MGFSFCNKSLFQATLQALASRPRVSELGMITEVCFDFEITYETSCVCVFCRKHVCPRM